MSDTSQSVPKHIGLILDGNRRWAKANNLPQLEGHRVGYDNLKGIAEAAFDRGVEFISAYVFSTENWDRSKKEVDYLMKLSHKMITRDYRDMNEKGIKICWMGSEIEVSDKLIKEMNKTIELTKDNTRGTLSLCFNYGGHRELSEAVKKMLADGYTQEDINETAIEKYLYNPTIPAVDFLIRTSGEQRISNFMLWRAAYSELYFTDVLWPDFSVEDLDKALAEFAARQRRFGG